MFEVISLQQFESALESRESANPPSCVGLVLLSIGETTATQQSDYFARWRDYSAHLGDDLDLYHVGYYNEITNAPNLRGTIVHGTRGTFYPDLFWTAVRELRERCGYQYGGGLDFLLFDVSDAKRVNWNDPTILRSNDYVPTTFPSLEIFFRELANSAQRHRGRAGRHDYRTEFRSMRAKQMMLRTVEWLGKRVQLGP